MVPRSSRNRPLYLSTYHTGKGSPIQLQLSQSLYQGGVSHHDVACTTADERLKWGGHLPPRNIEGWQLLQHTGAASVLCFSPWHRGSIICIVGMTWVTQEHLCQAPHEQEPFRSRFKDRVSVPCHHLQHNGLFRWNFTQSPQGTFGLHLLLFLTWLACSCNVNFHFHLWHTESRNGHQRLLWLLAPHRCQARLAFLSGAGNVFSSSNARQASAIQLRFLWVVKLIEPFLWPSSTWESRLQKKYVSECRRVINHTQNGVACNGLPKFAQNLQSCARRFISATYADIARPSYWTYWTNGSGDKWSFNACINASSACDAGLAG